MLLAQRHDCNLEHPACGCYLALVHQVAAFPRLGSIYSPHYNPAYPVQAISLPASLPYLLYLAAPNQPTIILPYRLAPI